MATGAIIGMVSDPQGKFIGSAVVDVLNMDTGAKQSTESTYAGLYSAPLLNPGRYCVTVRKDGFRMVSRCGLRLSVGDTQRVDFSLSLNTTRETLTINETIESGADAESAALDSVVTGRTIAAAPLNARNFMHLVALTPGAIPILSARRSLAGFVTGNNDVAVNIGGGRDDANSFLLDGIETRQPWLVTPSIFPSLDAIQEFRVSRSLYSAEFGQGTGIIQISTKSGTNKHHGSAFEFFRNSDLDARAFLDGSKPPPVARNQFGGSLGGPLNLPKVYRGSSRTFFFLDYEGLRSRQSATRLGVFPTLKNLSGDFSGETRAVIDPENNTPFPRNIIPPSRMSSVTSRYAFYIPAPNLPGAGANYSAAPPRKDDSNQVSVRLDHRIGTADSAMARYARHDELTVSRGLAPLSGSIAPISGQNATIQEQHVFGPKTFQSFRLGFNRGTVGSQMENTSEDLASSLGFRNLGLTPRDYGLPRVTIAGYTVTGQPGLNQGSTSDTLEVSETTIGVRGRHRFSAGADLRYVRLQRFSTTNRQGAILFSGAFTSNAVADFLLGIAGSVSYFYGQSYNYSTSWQGSVFLQDDWQVLPKLTVNLGLRWEHNTPFRERNGREGFFDPSVPGGIVRISRDPKVFGSRNDSPLISAGNVPAGVLRPEYRDFAPRAGLAYRLSQSVAIRAGAGIFYGVLLANDLTAFTSTLPPLVLSPYISPGTLVDTLYPDVNNPAYQLSSPLVYSVDRNGRRPYSAQWNLSLQSTPARGTLFEAAYAGTRGLNLWDRIFLNQPALPSADDPNPLGSITSRRPFPAFGDVLQASFRDFSYYHALQTRTELRPTGGLTILLSYVFAKSIDTASGGTATTGHMDRTNLNREKALSNFDVRHALSLMYSYELPFRTRRRLSNAILGGWQTNGILTYYSGQPFSANLSADVAATGPGPQRADVLLNPNLPSAQRTPSRWFNTAAFHVPITGTFGNSGRNIIQGLPTSSLDASLFKNFWLKETRTLQVRIESFNSLNHPNYTDLNTTVGSPGFGAVTSAGPARQVQFAVKLLF